MGELVVGAAQREPLPCGDPLGPFAADVASTLATHPEIKLLVYPELHLAGTEHLPPAQRTEALERAAVPLDSEFIRALGQIAAEHEIWLCPGSIGERGSGGEFFNTQLLFDPAGTLRATYRKMFPWRPFEPHQPGTEFVVQELDGLAVAGLSICYDAWFPEHTRQLAYLGADLVLNIVKTTTPDREQELVLARANAIVNQNVMVSVNCAAPTGLGRSIVVGPEGYVLAEAGPSEDTLVVTFDSERVAQVRARGTLGTNRMWEQFYPGDATIELPLYAGRIDPSDWAPRTGRR